MLIPAPDAIAAWLADQRWFAGKTRRIAGVTVEDRLPVGDATLVIGGVALDDGSVDRYALPLRSDTEPQDALDTGGYAASLFDLIGYAGHVRGDRGEIAGVPTRALPVGASVTSSRRAGTEQSNTSVALGDLAMLKHFRRLAPGVNPEQEVSRFLTERARFPHAPRLYGHVEYRVAGESFTLAVAHELVPDAVDGWTWITGALGHALASTIGVDAFLAAAEPTLVAVERLGEVTAKLHRALASAADDPAFAPEPIGMTDIARWTDGIRRRIDDARAALADVVLPALPPLADGLGALAGAVMVRHHGDFHLGQTLYRPRRGDWLVIDFEGEPLRPMAERRAKHTALRDVAGLLRSIDYAATAIAAGDARARRWERAAVARYLAGYRRHAAGAPFVPATDAAFARALAVFVLEKAAYEIVYEARHRPAWVRIPVEGFTRAAAALTSSAGAP